MPLNIDWQQILLHLLNFAILGGGLYFLLYKPVKDFMDKRIRHYEELENTANEKIRKAEEDKVKYDEKLKAVEEEISREKAEAQKSMEKTAAEQMAEARKQADDMIAEARKQAERQKEKTLHNAQKELREMAVSMRQQMAEASTGNAFDQFLDVCERGMNDEKSEH